MAATPGEIELLVRESVMAEVMAMTLYTRMANRVREDEPRRLLRMLAAAEESHIGRITELLDELGEEATWALAKLGMVSVLRVEASKHLEDQLQELGLSEASTVYELLTFAIAMEESAGEKYQRLAADRNDERVRTFFAVLVEEEAGHAAQLLHLRQMLEASSPKG